MAVLIIALCGEGWVLCYGDYCGVVEMSGFF